MAKFNPDLLFGHELEYETLVRGLLKSIDVVAEIQLCSNKLMEVREIVNSIGSDESPMASQRATNQIDHLQRRVSNLARGFSRDELPESAVKLIHLSLIHI